MYRLACIDCWRSYWLVMATGGLTKGKLLAVIGDEVCTLFALVSFNDCL